MKITIRYFMLLSLFHTAASTLYTVHAQNVTSVSGMVKDSISGEPLPFVSVYFEGTTIGMLTDENGRFTLQHKGKHLKLSASSLEYNPKTISLKAGQKNEGLELLLQPAVFQLSEVVVKPKREKYRRKDNPAVKLIKKVIEHKDENRIESKDKYQAEVYEKLVLSLDDFKPNLDKNKMLRKFKFIQNYVDTSAFNGKPILTVSVREKLSDVYYRKSPKVAKTLVKAKRMQGIDYGVDDGVGITSNLEEIFKTVNIFDNNIPILLNRFVSPLSSTQAVNYYQYYIMDTLDVAGDPCIDLAFVPVNRQSYGFTGHLYITQDGRYSIKKVLLNTPTDINLNWVDQLRIEQEFKQMPDSTWIVSKENTFINFYIVKGVQKLHAHHLRNYDKYDFQVQKADSVFGLLGTVHVSPEAVEQPDTFWQHNRPIPLKEKEDAVGDLLAKLRKIPVFHAIKKTAEILITGYIPTDGDKKKTKFDFGPMYNTISANRIEGLRLRAGGMTTANLNPYWFASGYLAYGFKDRKPKYNLKLTHSFNQKLYFEGESPLNNLSFMHEYDLYTPGQDFLFTSKDNLFLAWKVGEPITKMQYIRKSVLQYEKEWLNGLTWKSWMLHQNSEAAGTLRYMERDAAGNLHLLKDFTTAEIGTQLRFAPGERLYNGRAGKGSSFNLSKDAPVFKLSHQIGIKGVLGGDYNYHHTEVSAEKHIWLSSFGRLDVQAKAGKVWSKVPFPLLILPNANQSITIQPESFHLMNALEFVADQYVSFNATYYLKGWILNRIPIINWLRLREVVSFNMIYGGLTDKNNPALTPGLFLLPEGTRPLGKTPYMEASIGLDNIFKILRIDYYRRLTYLNGPGIQKSGFRVALRFSF
ncbi:DUF5686 family protein [Bacteroides thetaiotaomicron]|uniref:DUF5686 and carboxypeptidase-like regulatory domain-containing protein n=1 Tax=Bacteroides thetaiotaomicron TaxID=818 RepID=UPI0039B6BAD3